ncbi:hypothetical protein CDAR_370611 [Caerostris darwini]|uniref:Ycf15 n=1 Tax=Caerostris darwini TaxID=1538125 RepID=A0AAV4VH26_9ARAC|nr:hypothetical protein CDAR_370611 [Caerostris darwini]
MSRPQNEKKSMYFEVYEKRSSSMSSQIMIIYHLLQTSNASLGEGPRHSILVSQPFHGTQFEKEPKKECPRIIYPEWHTFPQTTTFPSELSLRCFEIGENRAHERSLNPPEVKF